VGDADLRHKERLAGVSNAADQLGERLVIGLFLLLNQELGREEASLVPVVHL
jgi:hypothetical protein